MTESEKMKLGLWYDANFDDELVKQRLIAEDLCFELNSTRPSKTEDRNAILNQLIPSLGKTVRFSLRLSRTTGVIAASDMTLS